MKNILICMMAAVAIAVIIIILSYDDSQSNCHETVSYTTTYVMVGNVLLPITTPETVCE